MLANYVIAFLFINFPELMQYNGKTRVAIDGGEQLQIFCVACNCGFN